MDTESRPETLKKHTGIEYGLCLQKFHKFLKPRRYLEIGVNTGASLKLAECASIGIDPQFKIEHDFLGKKAQCHLFQMSSDTFFADLDPVAVLSGPIDLAFLDGMHLFGFCFGTLSIPSVLACLIPLLPCMIVCRLTRALQRAPIIRNIFRRNMFKGPLPCLASHAPV